MKSLPELLAWLARHLGVENPRLLRLWILRLFVLPPTEARELPQWLNKAMLASREVMIHELGIRQPDSMQEWLLGGF